MGKILHFKSSYLFKQTSQISTFIKSFNFLLNISSNICCILLVRAHDNHISVATILSNTSEISPCMCPFSLMTQQA